MGPPDSEVTLKAVWSKLCIPLAPEKQEGPSTELTFLGLGGNPGSLDSTQDKHTQRIGITNWNTPTCMYGGPARENIYA